MSGNNGNLPPSEPVAVLAPQHGTELVGLVDEYFRGYVRQAIEQKELIPVSQLRIMLDFYQQGVLNPGEGAGREGLHLGDAGDVTEPALESPWIPKRAESA